MKNNKIKVGVVGVSGYTGLELIKIIFNHPIFELCYAANSEGNTTIDVIYPSLKSVVEISVEKFNAKDCANKCELVFLALPHKTAMQSAKELLANGVKVVDLSADYRLTQENYEKNYCTHEDIDNLSHAIYSVPELHKNIAYNSKLIANPGCHVTASLLAIAPFLNHINLDTPIFIDSKTGVSGAGKTPTATTHFVNVDENLYSYNIIKHRHATEIEQHASALINSDVKVTFVPTLIPMVRGMIATVYATLKNDIDVLQTLKDYYASKKFIRICNEPPHAKNVSGTHFADVYVAKNKNALVSFCAIDNLLRGASSQAIANANIMMGLDESLGLPIIAYTP